MCKWSCICVYDCMHIAIILLYQDIIYIQAAESCNSPNLFNLENQRLLFERLKLNGWMLFQVAVAQGFMDLVSRHQHSSCMMWLLPNQHLTIRLMMVEMVNICTHSINSNMWVLGIFFRKHHSFCSGEQQATLPASAHGARPTTVSPCNCTEAARLARKTWPTYFYNPPL